MKEKFRHWFTTIAEQESNLYVGLINDNIDQTTCFKRPSISFINNNEILIHAQENEIHICLQDDYFIEYTYFDIFEGYYVQPTKKNDLTFLFTSEVIDEILF